MKNGIKTILGGIGVGIILVAGGLRSAHADLLACMEYHQRGQRLGCALDPCCRVTVITRLPRREPIWKCDVIPGKKACYDPVKEKTKANADASDCPDCQTKYLNRLEKDAAIFAQAVEAVDAEAKYADLLAYERLLGQEIADAHQLKLEFDETIVRNDFDRKIGIVIDPAAGESAMKEAIRRIDALRPDQRFAVYLLTKTGTKTWLETTALADHRDKTMAARFIREQLKNSKKKGSDPAVTQFSDQLSRIVAAQNLDAVVFYGRMSTFGSVEAVNRAKRERAENQETFRLQLRPIDWNKTKAESKKEMIRATSERDEVILLPEMIAKKREQVERAFREKLLEQDALVAQFEALKKKYPHLKERNE